MRIDRETGDEDAFEQLVRVLFHQHAVLAGAGLALVGVDDDVFGFRRGLRNEAPLQAGWKTGAAAATQARRFHLVDDLFGLHGDGFVEGFVAVGREIGIEGLRVGKTKAP